MNVNTFLRKQHESREYYETKISGSIYPFLTEQNLERLEPRERHTIRLLYGLPYGEQTLDTCAQILGITRERVRQIQLKALRKMKRRGWRLKQWVMPGLILAVATALSGCATSSEMQRYMDANMALWKRQMTLNQQTVTAMEMLDLRVTQLDRAAAQNEWIETEEPVMPIPSYQP